MVGGEDEFSRPICFLKTHSPDKPKWFGFSIDFLQNQTSSMDKSGTVVLDIECLAQSSEISSGSPKMTKALSRKGSSRIDRRNGEEHDVDESSKKLVVKVASSQLDSLKQPLISNKPLVSMISTSTNSCNLAEVSDGRHKRFSRFIGIHPRKVLLIFATVSSMGSLILIYFTLAINRTSRA
ncbi:uncharacterized protein LOC143886321 isoform X1 [Tasmannia lanceolata]|uniref:uncharacterized protein LOC143886321 isoform X1 n=1 Tax=Tasmannia lanceolata TaxID=3420 RepID=UPI00406320D5